MWLLYGLIGLMMAGTLADAFLRFADHDDDEPPPPPETGTPDGETPADTGDIFDYMPETPPPAGPVTDPWLGEWVDDEFISTDTPQPAPGDLYLRLDDLGGVLQGGAGNDTLIGGAGDDLIFAGEGDNQLWGGDGDDTLTGGSGASTLHGGAGNDQLFAGAGPGVLMGGAGDDTLTGGEHDDSLFGGSGDDVLIGGWGDDLLVAGSGNNQLWGGAGNDTLVGVALDPDGRDTGGINFLNGGDGDDLIVLGVGDVASGGSGSDTFVLGDWLLGGSQATITDFHPGEDRLILAYAATGGPAPQVQIDLTTRPGAALIVLEGQVIARLDGVQTLSPADIALQPV